MANRFKALNAMTPSEQMEYRVKFWNLVDKKDGNDCWPWKGKTIPQGYGYLYHPIFNTTLAHVLAYMISKYNTVIVKPVEDVMHSCNNVICCNPSHLKEGTASENIQHRFLSGRGFKLHPNQVWCLRILATATKIKNPSLGRLFNISACQVSRIKNGKRWWYLKSPTLPVS